MLAPGSDAAPLNALEFEAFARLSLPKSVFDYYAAGADDMVTLEENRRAFRRLQLRPKVLRDVSEMDISTTLLGERVATPVCVAPTSTHCMAHPDGERASSRAAMKANTCFVLSTMATTSLEEVAGCGAALRWFQLYVFKNRGWR